MVQRPTSCQMATSFPSTQNVFVVQKSSSNQVWLEKRPWEFMTRHFSPSWSAMWTFVEISSPTWCSQVVLPWCQASASEWQRNLVLLHLPLCASRWLLHPRGSTVCGLVAQYFHLLAPFNRCGFPRQNMMSKDLQLSIASASNSIFQFRCNFCWHRFEVSMLQRGFAKLSSSCCPLIAAAQRCTAQLQQPFWLVILDRAGKGKGWRRKSSCNFWLPNPKEISRTFQTSNKNPSWTWGLPWSCVELAGIPGCLPTAAFASFDAKCQCFQVQEKVLWSSNWSRSHNTSRRLARWESKPAVWPRELAVWPSEPFTVGKGSALPTNVSWQGVGPVSWNFSAPFFEKRFPMENFVEEKFLPEISTTGFSWFFPMIFIDNSKAQTFGSRHLPGVSDSLGHGM